MAAGRGEERGGCLGKLRDAASTITIEPMLFVREVAVYNMAVIRENLKLERFCRLTLNRTAEECDAMGDGDHDDLLLEVQKLDNVFIFYEKALSMVVPVLLSAFIASWSDRRGRRLPLCLAILGTVLFSGVHFLVALFPSCPANVLLLGSFLQSAGGGWVLFFMASYSYIADKSSSQSRTFRLTVMSAIWKLGHPVGILLGAWLYDLRGYLWVFGTSFLLFASSLVYAAVVVRDQPAPDDGLAKPTSPWNPKNVVDLFRACLRKRQGNRRVHIVLMLVMMLCYYSCMSHKEYIWTIRVLNWDHDRYSLYTTVNQFMHEFVLLAMAPLVSYLRVHDCMVGAGTTFLLVAQLLAFGLITRRDQWWVPYLFVAVPATYPAVVMRSFLSKLCNAEEVGRIFSMLAILEVFWTVADSAIFTAVYGATLAFYPSFEHLVAGYFGLSVFAGFLAIHLSLYGENEYTVLSRSDASEEEGGDDAEE